MLLLINTQTNVLVLLEYGQECFTCSCTSAGTKLGLIFLDLDCHDLWSKFKVYVRLMNKQSEMHCCSTFGVYF